MKPMLLKTKPEDVPLKMLEKLGKTLAEIKFDGERIIVSKDNDGHIEIRNRAGREKSKQYPEIFLDMRMVQEKGFIIDGEAITGQGTPKDFPNLQSRAHIKNPGDYDIAKNKVTFVVFDMLRKEGKDLDMEKLWNRKEKLRDFFKDNIFNLSNCKEISYTKNLEWLWEKALEEGKEGIILKDVNSYYNAGKRTWCWLKYKKKESYNLVVTGYTSKKRVISSLITEKGNVTLPASYEYEKKIPELIEKIPQNKVSVEVECDDQLTKGQKFRFPVLKGLHITP